MKANKFIKDFGINEAKQILKDLSFNEWRKDKAYFDEILRLIESHELVDKLGGIDAAYDEAGSYYTNESRMIEISQAISDVESCNV